MTKPRELTFSLNEIVHAVCMRNNNWFVGAAGQEQGEFELREGRIKLGLNLKVGAWVLLSPGCGCFMVSAKSYAKNGKFIYTLQDAPDTDFAFAGVVYEMRLPLGFLRTAERIQAWANSDEAKPTALAGETVAGVYTWRRNADKNGVPLGWQELFAKETAQYRRHVTGVRG